MPLARNIDGMLRCSMTVALMITMNYKQDCPSTLLTLLAVVILTKRPAF